MAKHAIIPKSTDYLWVKGLPREAGEYRECLQRELSSLFEAIPELAKTESRHRLFDVHNYYLPLVEERGGFGQVDQKQLAWGTVREYATAASDLHWLDALKDFGVQTNETRVVHCLNCQMWAYAVALDKALPKLQVAYGAEADINLLKNAIERQLPYFHLSSDKFIPVSSGVLDFCKSHEAVNRKADLIIQKNPLGWISTDDYVALFKRLPKTLTSNGHVVFCVDGHEAGSNGNPERSAALSHLKISGKQFETWRVPAHPAPYLKWSTTTTVIGFDQLK